MGFVNSADRIDHERPEAAVALADLVLGNVVATDPHAVSDASDRQLLGNDDHVEDDDVAHRLGVVDQREL